MRTLWLLLLLFPVFTHLAWCEDSNPEFKDCWDNILAEIKIDQDAGPFNIDQADLLALLDKVNASDPKVAKQALKYFYFLGRSSNFTWGIDSSPADDYEIFNKLIAVEGNYHFESNDIS